MTWDSLSDLLKFDVVVVHVCLLGQTVFLVLWATLPWWRSWVGRALMIKSVSLWILFSVNLALFWWLMVRDQPFVHEELIALSTHVLVLVGIWSQVVAIAREMVVAKRAHRQVVGTRSRDAHGREVTFNDAS